MQLCWLLDRKTLFNRICRINAKSYPFTHAFLGVRFKVVRESACMACKRSAVRSRYSPPKKHCTSFEVRCFSFCFLESCRPKCFDAQFCRLMDGNPQFLLFRCFWKGLLGTSKPVNSIARCRLWDSRQTANSSHFDYSNFILKKKTCRMKWYSRFWEKMIVKR